VTANCAGCPAGRFQHLWGKYFCYGCPSGKFNNKVGQSFCPSCPHCRSSLNVATSCFSLARNCRVSQWSMWGKCDKTCHDGHAHRTRSVVVAPYCGGKTCPTLKSKAGCMLRPCDCSKVKCKYEKHTCTDYKSGFNFKGWKGLASSNKGSCYNNGLGKKICGHFGNAGACALGLKMNCHDLDRLMLKNGRWIAKPNPTGLAGVQWKNRHNKWWGTCKGTHTSIRVYHSKFERRGVDKVLEGHHCKMIGSSCRCRCHKLFRHNYNPMSCDNTNPKVTQPTGMPGRKRFGKGIDDHITVDKKWSCKMDQSLWNAAYYPKHRMVMPTPFPTPAPTPNPCNSGSHTCDRKHGFCLKETHTLYKCGCKTDYMLANDKRTCVYQKGVNRL